LQDFLEDQARQHDIFIAGQQSRELLYTRMVRRSSLPQGQGPDRGVDQYSQPRRRLSAL
jgi:hypothetical protein